MNYLISLLLIVLIVIELRRNTGAGSIKKYFQNLKKQAPLAFAKLDFELYGLRVEREEYRKEYDRLNESLNAYQQQVDNEKNTDETKKLFEQKIAETKNVLEQVKDAINNKDININVAEETQADLQRQMRNLSAYMEREL